MVNAADEFVKENSRVLAIQASRQNFAGPRCRWFYLLQCFRDGGKDIYTQA